MSLIKCPVLCGGIALQLNGDNTLLFNPLRTFQAIGLLAVSLALSACQTYEPRPLNFEAHRDAWRGRLADDVAVAVFVQNLQAQGALEADRFDVADGLTLLEAELITLVFNPDLRLVRLRAGVADATAKHAGLWDDPKFAINLLRILEDISTPWVIAPSLSVTLPISGRLKAEKARANAAAKVALTRVAEAEWSARHDLRKAWWTWSALSLRLNETRRLLDTLVTLVEATSQLAKAGELPRTEAALFVIEEARLQQAARRLKAEHISTEYRLRALLGLSPDASLTLHAVLSAANRPSLATADVLAAQNLTLARLKDAYNVAEQVLLREVRKQYPDITIGSLYESDEGQSRIGFTGGIPLPIFNANRQGIAEANAQRELARAAYETAYERLVGLLAQSLAQVDAHQEQREEMERVLVPMIDQQLQDARQMIVLGEGGGLVLLESLVRAYEIKLELIDIRLNEALSVSQVQQLLGPQVLQSTPAQSAVDDGHEVKP